MVLGGRRGSVGGIAGAVVFFLIKRNHDRQKRNANGGLSPNQIMMHSAVAKANSGPYEQIPHGIYAHPVEDDTAV